MLRIEDPLLAHSLRTGRPRQAIAGTVAALVTGILTVLLTAPLIALVGLLYGAGPAAVAAAVSTVMLIVRVWHYRRTNREEPGVGY